MKINRKNLRKLILKEMASMRDLSKVEYRAQMFKQTPGLVFGAIVDVDDPTFFEYDEDGDEEPNPELEQLHFMLQNIDQFAANVLMYQKSPQRFVDMVRDSIPDVIEILQTNPEFSYEPEAVIMYLQKVLKLTHDMSNISQG